MGLPRAVPAFCGRSRWPRKKTDMAVIGIFDSGAGGLSVLKEILKVLPSERYIYYSDNANCPYGDKSPGFITDRARSIVGMMLGKGADAVVVACNTATGAAVSTLRSEFPIPFIGMEPAVKPAALGTHSGVIGVLATAGTLRASKYLGTKELYGSSVRVAEHVGAGFVELVEHGELSGPGPERIVAASLRPLLDAGADTVVLGCTHYPFLLPVMRKVAGPGITFIDPAPAVARHLVEVLHREGIPFEETELTRRLLAESRQTDVTSAGGDTPWRRDAGKAGPAGGRRAAPYVELISSGEDTALRTLYAMILEGLADAPDCASDKAE